MRKELYLGLSKVTGTITPLGWYMCIEHVMDAWNEEDFAYFWTAKEFNELIRQYNMHAGCFTVPSDLED